MTSSIVDTHVHIWADGRTGDRPDHAAGTVAIEDARAEVFLDAMQAENVSAAVLVQYIGYRWDNAFVAEALRQWPDRFAGVCRVDPDDPSAPDQLSSWTEDHGFQGVRISPARCRDPDWMEGPLADPFFDRVAQLQVPVLILTEASRLPELFRMADRHPDIDFVIDHMADCDAANPEHRQHLKVLSRNPRIHLKIGHLWAHSVTGYPWVDQHETVRMGRDLFGAERLMWGSDWSLGLHHATYHQAVSYLQNEVAFLTADEIAAIMGRTARRLWRFGADQAARPPSTPAAAAVAAPAGSTGPGDPPC